MLGFWLENNKYEEELSNRFREIEAVMINEDAKLNPNQNCI